MAKTNALNSIKLVLLKDLGQIKETIACADVQITPCGLDVLVYKATGFSYRRFFSAHSFSEARWEDEA